MARCVPFRFLFCPVVAAALAASAAAQTSTTYTWNAASASLWGTPANWTPGTSTTGPGSATDPTNTDIAVFGSVGTSTTIQLNFGTIGTTRYLGTISQTGGVARTIGSNSGTAGTLVLNGTGANNLIIENTSTAALTLAPQAGGGTGPMTLSLVQSNSTISNVLGTSAANTGFVTISANITEGATPAGITKTGSGILILSGTNTFTGPTTISQGFVQYTALASLYNGSAASWTADNLVVQSGAAAVFRVGGTGGFATTDFDALKVLGTSTGGFMNGSGIGIDTTNAGLVYAGTIADTNGGANAIGFHKFGTNTLTLTGTNTYTGGTFVRTGVLQVSGSQAGLPSGGNVTIGDATTVTNTAQLMIGTTSQASPSTYTLGSVTATAAGGATALQVFILNATAANPTSVTVNDLTLTRGTATYSGTANLTINGALTLVSSPGNGAVGFNATFNVPTTTAYNSTTPISFSAQQSGSNAGFLGSRINLNGTANVLSLGASINQDANFTAGSTGTAQVTFQNAATLRLTGNIPTLLTTSLGPALTNPLPVLGFGAATGGVSGVIDTNGFGTTISTPITNIVNNTNGAITVTGGGTLTITGHNSFSGGMTLAAGTTLNINNGGVAAQSAIAASYATGASFVVVTAGSVPNLVVGQRLTGSGTSIAAGTFIRAIDTGTNTITLSQNTAAAGTNLGSAATSSLGTGTFTIQGGTIDNTSGGPVTLATNNAQIWAADFAYAGTNNLNLGTGGVTLTGPRTVTAGGSTLTVGGVIADGGSGFGLTKAGAGTLALGGANTYTGPTAVAGGRLLVNGSLAAGSAVSVTGGTLGGTGTVAGPITVGVGGTLSPGGTTSAGTLAAADAVTLASGATFLVKLGGTGAGQSDLLDLGSAGTIALGGAGLTGTLVNGYVPANADSITIIGGTGAGQVGERFSQSTAVFVGTAGGLNYFADVTYNPSSVVLSNFTSAPVPEPGHALALCAGAGGLVVLARRRRAGSSSSQSGGI